MIRSLPQKGGEELLCHPERSSEGRMQLAGELHRSFAAKNAAQDDKALKGCLWSGAQW